MTAEGLNYEISMLSGSKVGIFTDRHNLVHDNSAIYWEMTATNNLENYNSPVYESGTLITPGDQGLHPGSYGVISFYVTPKVDTLNLKFDFEIIGYQESIDDKGTVTETDDVPVLTALENLGSGTGVTAQNLLNGHILLFEHRDISTVGDVTTITYSTPILSDEDMHRIFYRTINGKDEAKPIDIYWVWPNTLSTLVDARNSGITTVPFCEDDDDYEYDSYSAITDNIEEYPKYYLKGLTSGTSVAVDAISANYDGYGDLYDQGDNEIGMRVNYLLLKLSISEGTAGGGGS